MCACSALGFPGMLSGCVLSIFASDPPVPEPSLEAPGPERCKPLAAGGYTIPATGTSASLAAGGGGCLPPGAVGLPGRHFPAALRSLRPALEAETKTLRPGVCRRTCAVRRVLRQLGHASLGYSSASASVRWSGGSTEPRCGKRTRNDGPAHNMARPTRMAGGCALHVQTVIPGSDA